MILIKPGSATIIPEFHLNAKGEYTIGSILYEGVMRLYVWWRLGALIMISHSWQTHSPGAMLSSHRVQETAIEWLLDLA